MSRLIVVISIVIIMIVGLIVEISLVSNIVDNLNRDVNELVTIFPEYENNISDLSDKVYKIRNSWEKKEKGLGLMFNHKELSNITDNLIKLHIYVQQDNYEEALVELNLLKHYSKKNTHNMGYSIHNVF